jgi:hypothetical protein
LSSPAAGLNFSSCIELTSLCHYFFSAFIITHAPHFGNKYKTAKSGTICKLRK